MRPYSSAHPSVALEKLPYFARMLELHTPKLKSKPAKDEELFKFARRKSWQKKLNPLHMEFMRSVIADYEEALRRIQINRLPQKEQQRKGKYENRKISFSKTMARQKAQAAERITADEGNILRRNRSIQVEGAFGIVKQDRDFRRFLTRGKAKTETQFFLIAFSFNINKLHNRTIYKRLGLELFNQEAA